MSFHGLASEPPPYDVTALTTYLESIVVASLHGLNKRNLSTSPVWSTVADNFTHGGMGYAATSKQDFMDDYLMYRQGYPDHHLQLTGMTTTLNSQMIGAQVFANVAVTGGYGVPIGMSRQVVIICDFQKREGRWLFVRTTTLPGEGGVVE